MIKILEILAAFLSITLQGTVVYYGYRLYKIMKPTRYWTSAWILFCISMSIITLRRCLAAYYSVQSGHTSVYFLESFLLIAISCLLIGFVLKLKILFIQYIKINGREAAVSKREREVTKREKLLIVEPDIAEIEEPHKVIVDVLAKKVTVQKPKKVIVVNPKKVVEETEE
jgi:hypothetical protein